MPVSFTCQKCGKHAQARRNGSRKFQYCSRECANAVIAAARRAVDIEKFLQECTSSSKEGCWEWPGYRDNHGYGRINFQGAKMKAHRLAYQIAKGLFEQSLCVCHTCDNPPCIRPDHLFLGTHQDNLSDAAQKGRFPRGERHHAARLTEADVRAIRASGLSVSALARDFGISRRSIQAIKDQKSWSWTND